MTKSQTAAVIGAGPGALCWAAHLAELGFTVYVGANTIDGLKAVATTGSIAVIDGSETHEFLVAGCGNPVAVAQQASVVILCVPAERLPVYRELLEGVLTAGQLLVLAPGGIGGALYFGRDEGYQPAYNLVELNTLPFIVRKADLRTVHRMATLREVFWASLPSERGPELEMTMLELLPVGTQVPSVLQTSLTNFNSVIHPAAMAMNAGRIEALGAFYWYREGSTPAIGRVMDALDAERMSLQKALELPEISFVEYFDRAGYAPGTVHEGGIAGTLRNSRANTNVVGPATLDHRFITEDVPYGLVPIHALGVVCGVATGVTEALILMSEIAMGEPYRQIGFNANRLGIKGMSLRQLQDAVTAGNLGQYKTATPSGQQRGESSHAD